MNKNVDVLAVLNPERELSVKQSSKNANAGFVDWRDWCAYVGRTAEARAAVVELIDKVDSYVTLGHSETAYRELSAALARVKGF